MSGGALPFTGIGTVVLAGAGLIMTGVGVVMTKLASRGTQS